MTSLSYRQSDYFTNKLTDETNDNFTCFFRQKFHCIIENYVCWIEPAMSSTSTIHEVILDSLVAVQYSRCLAGCLCGPGFKGTVSWPCQEYNGVHA